MVSSSSARPAPQRPEVLWPLFAEVGVLKGVGPKVAPLLTRLAGPHVGDLLWHLPTGLLDRRHAPRIAEAPHGAVATLTVEVMPPLPPENKRQPWRVPCRDDSGTLILVFFHTRPEWLQRTLPPGSTRVVSGKVEWFHDRPQMVHPDHIAPPETAAAIARVEPVYPLTTGVVPKLLHRALAGALDRAPDLPEWQDPTLMAREGWPPWRAALLAAHAPETPADLAPTAPPRRRLAYDELLANQLALALVRQSLRRRAGRARSGTGILQSAVRAALPFALTGSQEQALADIAADLAEPVVMMRLLQGDVGSGKTVVALLAMLVAVEEGQQAALMAPTELLARQHQATMAPLAEAAGVRLALLTGKDRAAERRATLAGLADGSIALVVGTHALVQEEVAFHDLGLAVIDEQHRFGVQQRLALAGKGRAVDLLLMTATPIPRTLALAGYGDMDASRLTEKPAGRQPVDTRVLSLARLEEVAAGVRRAVAAGRRVYWVCPLVAEGEGSDLAAAEARHAHLAEVLAPVPVGLVHGRLKAADKQAAMQGFADGSLQVLVATTVIEVGMDVPEASVMVVEHAEAFGLAQLHQLRGRVGRGTDKATCLLLYDPAAGETARARLAVMRDSDDGFAIAEEDLRLRGPGEALGTRQTGLPRFRLADMAAHAELLGVAQDDARLVLDRDPDLQTERGRALRVLLYLFERDNAARYLRA